jgi:hypothetical protein
MKKAGFFRGNIRVTARKKKGVLFFCACREQRQGKRSKPLTQRFFCFHLDKKTTHRQKIALPRRHWQNDQPTTNQGQQRQVAHKTAAL